MTMDSPKETRAKIIAAAMDIAAAKEWRRASLADIAAAADLPLGELRAHFPSKPAILAGFIADVDRGVLAIEPGFEPEDTPRDRLFEILMSRLDALAAHRTAVAELCRDLPTDPLSALCLAPSVITSMSWMLEAAGIASTGPLGLLRAKGLLAVWLAVLRVWLRDESPDLAPTMAALDRHLRRAEQFAVRLDSFTPPGAKPDRPSR